MSTDHKFWREMGAEADSNRGLTARPNRLTRGTRLYNERMTSWLRVWEALWQEWMWRKVDHPSVSLRKSAAPNRRALTIHDMTWHDTCCETRFGLAVRQRDHGSILIRLSILFKSCGLWTLSCDFVPHSKLWNIKMALIAAHLNAEVILVVTV